LGQCCQPWEVLAACQTGFVSNHFFSSYPCNHTQKLRSGGRFPN
jgi:hypothetical protein